MGNAHSAFPSTPEQSSWSPRLPSRIVFKPAGPRDEVNKEEHVDDMSPVDPPARERGGRMMRPEMLGARFAYTPMAEARYPFPDPFAFG